MVPDQWIRRSTQIHFKGWANNGGLMSFPFAKIKQPIKSANFFYYLHAWGGGQAVGSFVPSSVLMSMAWGRRGGRWQRKKASLGEGLSSWTVGDRNNWKLFRLTVLFCSFFVSTPPPSHLKKKLSQTKKLKMLYQPKSCLWAPVAPIAHYILRRRCVSNF